MNAHMVPGLLLAAAGAAAWFTVTVGAWLSPLLPPPAGAPFRMLRTGPVASAAAMWTALAGGAWAVAVAALAG